MNFLIVFILLFTMPSFAKCKVYGISDSPQNLKCALEGIKIDLTCKGDQYFLNQDKVVLAFHLEVEEGTTPLVFKTNTDKTLIVIPEETILAEYMNGKQHRQGICVK